MSRFARIVAFLLLALWAPATMHCQFEAAGLLPEALACQTAADAGHCDDSACAQLEDSLYKNTSAPLKVPAPVLCAVVGIEVRQVLACLSAQTPREILPVKTGPPRDWIVRWAFVQRAAPPARAPSLNTLRA